MVQSEIVVKHPADASFNLFWADTDGDVFEVERGEETWGKSCGDLPIRSCVNEVRETIRT